MFYTVYKITNLINGKFYVGIHKTSNLLDSYMGSGRRIRDAIKKYGVENFRKEYLAIFDSHAEMVALEEEIVDSEFVKSENTYNLKLGGVSKKGWINGFKGQSHTKHSLQKISMNSQRCWDEGVFDRKIMGEKISRSLRHLYASGAIEPSFKGRTHTDEARQKQREAALARDISGDKNPNFGTCWIYRSTDHASQRINKSDLDIWLADGWIKGRKMAPVSKSDSDTSLKIDKTDSDPVAESTRAKGRFQKVSDEDYIVALKEHPSISKALQSLGLQPRGKNYTRAKRLLGYADDVKLNTNGTPKPE